MTTHCPTTRRYPRTAADAFPDATWRSGIEGPTPGRKRDRPWRLVAYTLALFAALCVGALLLACGGSDDEADAVKRDLPPMCNTDPAACK